MDLPDNLIDNLEKVFSELIPIIKVALKTGLDILHHTDFLPVTTTVPARTQTPEKASEGPGHQALKRRAIHPRMYASELAAPVP